MLRIIVSALVMCFLVAGGEAQDGICKTLGRVQTCVVTEAWGTRTTQIVLDAKKMVGGKVQNVKFVEIAFSNYQADESAFIFMVGGIMMLAMPLSTPDQRGEILARMAKSRNTYIEAFGWNWYLGSDKPPAITFRAAPK